MIAILVSALFGTAQAHCDSPVTYVYAYNARGQLVMVPAVAPTPVVVAPRPVRVVHVVQQPRPMAPRAPTVALSVQTPRASFTYVASPPVHRPAATRTTTVTRTTTTTTKRRH